MIIFQNSKSFKANNLNYQERTISTLLVPAHLLNGLRKRTKESGISFIGYFRNLLKQYRILTHSGMIPKPRKIKTEYQNEGLNLKRINFRVSNSDWIEIGELALAFGKSRCWVFTFLLELDLNGLAQIFSESKLDGVPTHKNLELKIYWSLEKSLQVFTRSYHVKV